MGVLESARASQQDLVRFRREMHRDPEIGLQLPRTQQRVLDALEPLGFEVSTGRSVSSVVAVVRGSGSGSDSGRAVLLRADMDALPVAEETGVGYASAVEGAMHACGHDLHTAMLVGAARLLAERRDELPGDVVLMFQPGEEGLHGARAMIEEGVLDAAGPRVEAAYGMHVFSAIDPGGTFITRPGPILAASDEVRITVRGRGGHGSTPALALDPVPAAAEIVTATQAMVTRRFSAFDPVVVTFGLLQAGTKSNVIPGEARLEATLRTFSAESRERLEELLPTLARDIAHAHGAEAEVTFDRGYPVTDNHLEETRLAAEAMRELFGDERHVEWEHPLAGSEDFSYVLEQVPGSFVGLSAVPEGADPMASAFNHSPRAVFDDSVLADGAALYVELALRQLARSAS